MAANSKTKTSLLSSQVRVQSPWIKVVIGSYTFGVFDNKTKNNLDDNGFYTHYNIKYPRYIDSLSITKVNGQVNQYTLSLRYPVRPFDDPNFIEKVLSSVSKTRKIIFSYGDAAMPTYVYKNEEALITKVSQQFDLQNSVINYTISAVSSSVVGTTGSFTFTNSGKKKPSDEIKKIFLNPRYGLTGIFTGMSESNLDQLIAGGDKAVELKTQVRMSPLDYIRYLVSCMLPESSSTDNISSAIYILTLHDESIFDPEYNVSDIINNENPTARGPYFKVTRTSYALQYSDAYEIDVGFNSANIVTSFQVSNDENYAIFFDYNSQLNPESYTRMLNNKGQWEDVYAPMVSSKNETYQTRAEDVSWMTKVTKYPISASIRVQGLLRPARLMQYIRLNVVFPGGNKHISSGLYTVTKQTDEISGSGYFTTLSLTRIAD